MPMRIVFHKVRARSDWCLFLCVSRPSRFIYCSHPAISQPTALRLALRVRPGLVLLCGNKLASMFSDKLSSPQRSPRPAAVVCASAHVAPGYSGRKRAAFLFLFSQKQPRLTEFFLASPSRRPPLISGPIRSWPVASRPGLSSASMFVPMRYWETRSRLVPSRGPLAAPAPHGGFLRPWFLGFEAPHPPPAAVVDSAWVPRRRDTPGVLLFFC